MTATAQGDPLMERRPTTRGDCVHGPRPCPWVSCRYHLYVDRLVGGGRWRRVALRRSRDSDGDDGGPSCSLDVADDGPHTLGEVGAALGITRERVRQIESRLYLRLVEDGVVDHEDIDLCRWQDPAHHEATRLRRGIV